MRAFLWLICLAAAAECEPVRVLSYNIHHAEGTDGRFDLERIAKVILSVAPDLVALQEVDVRTRRSSGIDQAGELGRLTGLHVVFGRTIPYQDGWYGNAVLSRWPLAGFENHPLPSSEGREKRAVIEARAEAPVRFTLWATHLDIAERDRVAAAKALRERVRDNGRDGLMLLAGDLNAVEGSEPMKILLEDWRLARLGEPLPTTPVVRPTRQIDYILYRPAAGWRVVEARVLEEEVASDHRAIFAVLEPVEAGRGSGKSGEAGRVSSGN